MTEVVPQLGPPILLTREQAAEWCQVSLQTIDEWADEPGFPVLRRPGGRFVRIHRAELDRWLAQRAVEANPEPVREVPAAPRRRRSRSWLHK